MKFFTFLIMFTGLAVAGCAAYFSVSGLAALFAGAFWSIIIMGGILEAGKLIATSFLYRYWKHITLFLKTYLVSAVFILMVITSVGIFGYLSRAHIEQQGNITDAEVIVDRIDSKLGRDQLKINDMVQRLESLRSNNIDFSNSISQQESIRDSAWAMVQSDIDFEQSQINDIQNVLKDQLNSLDRKYELDLQDLNAEQDRIENELRLISNEERGIFSRNQSELKNSLRSQQLEIVNKKDRLRNLLSEDKQLLRQGALSRIQVHQDRITEFRSNAQSTIDTANQKINELREEENLAVGLNIEKISNLQGQIDDTYSKMDNRKEEKFNAEAKVRIVESEVGPVKYVAEVIYGDTDKSTLERAIRFLIIMIVFVFDPLAVSLILAYNFIVMLNKDQPPTLENKSDLKNNNPLPVDRVESHKQNLLQRFTKVKTQSGKIKDFKDTVLAQTDLK